MFWLFLFKINNLQAIYKTTLRVKVFPRSSDRDIVTRSVN